MIEQGKESAARLWARALREFDKLAGVDADPARMNSIADLIFIAQFEIDLVNEGESAIDVRPHRKFVKKWSAA
jgi:hypothetical protein